jgi:putative membrane protein
MSSTLQAPTVAGLATDWQLQPVALVAAVALVAWYWYAVRGQRASGAEWPRRRVVLFSVGLALGIWTTCGLPEVYGRSLFWIWTSQQLGLLLILPAVILSGGPLELARIRGGAEGRVSRIVASAPIRALGNPLVGPALVPLMSVLLFFGPIPGWAIRYTAVGWVMPVLVLAAGSLVVLRLVGLQSNPSSMAVGLALAIGSFELVLDAVPGIALRLHHTVTTSFFDYRLAHVWAHSPIHDQQLAGTIVWCVAELIDLPFLVLVYRQWVRADARDAATVDAVLEAERISRGAATSPTDAAGLRAPGAPGAPEEDVPWWIADEAMRNRLRRQA